MLTTPHRAPTRLDALTASGTTVQVLVRGVWIDGQVREVGRGRSGWRYRVRWSVGVGHERIEWYDDGSVRPVPSPTTRA